MHSSRRAFYKYAKCYRPPFTFLKFFTQVSHQFRDRFRQVGTCQRWDTYVGYCLSPFANCLIPPIESTFENLLRVHRACWKHFVYGLKAEDQTLKTLQQGIVQFPRDACPLADACFQADTELMM